MLEKLTAGLDFQAQALALRAQRQTILASNIANADTPGYQSRDIDFSKALQAAQGGGSALPLAQPNAPALATAHATGVGSINQVGTANSRHIPLTIPSMGAGSSGNANSASTDDLAYGLRTQPSLDNNTVDLDRERAAFSDNSVRYEAALRFINGSSKTILSAITGQ